MAEFTLSKAQSQAFQTSPFIDIHDSQGNYHRLVDCSRFRLPETSEEAKTRALSQIALLESLFMQHPFDQLITLDGTERDGLVFMLSGIKATLQVPETNEGTYSTAYEAAASEQALNHG
jgi:hypothetical protein